MTIEANPLYKALSAPRASLWARLWAGHLGPILVIIVALLAVWYAACVIMNEDAVTRTAADPAALTVMDRVWLSFQQDRPVIPAPNQVAGEMWRTIALVSPFSKRSLLYHGWVTFSGGMLGFLFGTALGVALAVLIVHVRSLQKSLMPWIVVSQTIPILAIAPMVVVVLGRPPLNLTGIVPKAIIATYLCYFPVAIGMVKGLRSPDPMQLDLMRTYNASPSQIFWMLRLPASMPFLFTSLKVGIASGIVAAIVAEMPTSTLAGFGSRLLAGSQFGQPMQIWAALFAGAALSATLVAMVGAAERRTLRAMGMAP